MTRIAYLDTVSTAPPVYGRPEPWRAHCIRVAVALEEDRKIIATLLRLVDLLPWVPIDPDWMTRYGVAGLPADDAELPLIVAQNVSVMLAGATVVCQNQAFHRDVLLGLFEDAGIDGPDVDGHVCIMKTATPIVGARTVVGDKPKSPNLGESFKFFSGEVLPPVAGMAWKEAALVQLNAVRRVYWGINQWGVPGDRIEGDT